MLPESAGASSVEVRSDATLCVRMTASGHAAMIVTNRRFVDSTGIVYHLLLATQVGFCFLISTTCLKMAIKSTVNFHN